MKASAKGGTLRASGPANHVDVNDVVVGEVWVASGQSNMEWSMAQSFQPEADIAASSNPNLRLFTVTKRRSAEPKLDLDYAPHAWAVASPDTVKRFSAVGYYFGRDLVAALPDVPVGMIHTSWGGSPAEAWMSVAALEADAEYRSKILAPYAESRANWEKSVADWEKKKADAMAKGEKFNEGRPWQPWQPGELYGGMLANIIPFGIRGAIWYQGESNAGRAWQYRRLFADMITNWRRDWGQGDFPFYAVQLAPWDKNRKRDLSVIAAEIGESDWAELREAQNYVAETLPNVGIAVITDVGDKDDIHPTRKGPVGERLARLARDEVYGEPILAYGPRLKSAQFEDEFVQLRFRDAGLGLTTLDGKPPTGFIVAGADKKWYPAIATFQGNQTILLRSDSVPRPVAVRYGWNDHPLLNLVNSDDLPASPFRTDNWPVTTQGK
jgi:sialate O-acetylesterase